MIRLNYIALVTIIAAGMLTCMNPFAPKSIDSLELNRLITNQQSPDEVLTNFKYAYTFKDSTLYSNLIVSSFVFVYFDPNLGTSGRFVSWGRDDELRTTGRLFRNFSVIDLTWNSTIYSIEQETIAESSKSFRLSLSNADETITISGNAIFSFKLDEKENVWRITRWKDESSF